MSDAPGRVGRLASDATAADLAAAVAHDLNNALTGVYGGLDFAAEDLRRGAPERLPEDIAQAREGAERIRDIVRRLEGRGAAATPPASAPTPAVDTTAGRRVLVIDDEQACVDLVTMALVGHQVVACASPREALVRVAMGEPFDAVLCDLSMDELDGVAVVGAIRAMDPRLGGRVVLMSGGPADPRMRAFLDGWGGRTLSKPFSLSTLRETLAEALAAG